MYPEISLPTWGILEHTWRTDVACIWRQPCSKGSAIPTFPVWDWLQLGVTMIWERYWVSVLPVQVAFQGIRREAPSGRGTAWKTDPGSSSSHAVLLQGQLLQ